jgi:hypothetical protein
MPILQVSRYNSRRPVGLACHKPGRQAQFTNIGNKKCFLLNLFYFISFDCAKIKSLFDFIGFDDKKDDLMQK